MSRNTKQKQIIEKEIEKMHSFFDAEKLLAKVSKKDNNIALATIYRYLKNSVDKGGIHSYNCNRKSIYTVGVKNHCHFICEICNDIKHIKLKKIDFINNEIDGEICHFQLDITGICKKCLNKD